MAKVFLERGKANLSQQLDMAIGDFERARSLDPGNHEVFTAHSTNRVPFALVMDDFEGRLREKGRLADVAPTILSLMRLEKPKEMEGENLII